MFFFDNFRQFNNTGDDNRNRETPLCFFHVCVWLLYGFWLLNAIIVIIFGCTIDLIRVVCIFGVFLLFFRLGSGWAHKPYFIFNLKRCFLFVSHIHRWLLISSDVY